MTHNKPPSPDSPELTRLALDFALANVCMLARELVNQLDATDPDGIELRLLAAVERAEALLNEEPEKPLCPPVARRIGKNLASNFTRVVTSCAKRKTR